MAIDKPDLKTGFWVGLGVVLALAVWGFVQVFLMKLVERNK